MINGQRADGQMFENISKKVESIRDYYRANNSFPKLPKNIFYDTIRFEILKEFEGDETANIFYNEVIKPQLQD